MDELAYHRDGETLPPNPEVTDEDEAPLRKYGRMRMAYLKEHHPTQWILMGLNEELSPHLREVDRQAYERLERMVPQMAKEAGATEELKNTDPLKWVGIMNSCKAQVEETILKDLICV